MKQKWINKLTALLLIYVMSAMTFGTFAQVKVDEKGPKYPNISKGRGSGSKSTETEKLSLELRILYAQYKPNNSKGGGDDSPFENAFSAEQLNEIFGISEEMGANPSIKVAITTDASVAALKKMGMKVYMRQGNTVYGEIPVLGLANLAGEKSVTKIAATKSAKNPEIPKEEKSPMMSKGTTTNADQKNLSRHLPMNLISRV